MSSDSVVAFSGEGSHPLNRIIEKIDAQTVRALLLSISLILSAQNMSLALQSVLMVVAFVIQPFKYLKFPLIYLLVAASAFWLIFEVYFGLSPGDNSAWVVQSYICGLICVAIMSSLNRDNSLINIILVGGFLFAGTINSVKIMISDNAATPVGYIESEARLEVANINGAAYLLVICFVVLLAVVKLSTIRSRWLLMAPASMMLIAVFQSDARGAVIAVGLATLWLLFPLRFCKYYSWWLGLPLLVLSGVVPVVASSSLVTIIESYFSRATGDLSGRTLVWAEALPIVWQSPILGSGADSTVNLTSSNIGIHNVTFTWLIEYGIVGLILLVSVIIAVFLAVRTQQSVDSDSALNQIDWATTGWCLAIAPISASGHIETSLLAWAGLGMLFRVGSATSILRN